MGGLITHYHIIAIEMISSVMDLSGGNRNDAVRRDVGRAEYPNLRVDVALSAYLASALRAALIIRSAFAKILHPPIGNLQYFSHLLGSE